MGLVIFLGVMKIWISGISEISQVFELKGLHDAAPARKRFRTSSGRAQDGSGDICPRKIESTYFGVVWYGHIYLSRIHAAVQCMAMFEGTALGALPANDRMHLPWSRIVWAHVSVAHSCHSAMHDHA